MIDINRIKFRQHSRLLNFTIAALLSVVLVLLTGVQSHAETPDAAYIAKIEGSGLVMGTGASRNRQNASLKEQLRGNKALYVPGNGAWANLSFIDDAPLDHVGLIVQAGPDTTPSQWLFPCAARGGFRIAWRRGNNNGCKEGVRLQQNNNRTGLLPNNTIQAGKNILKAQVNTEEVIVSPPNSEPTTIQTRDTGTGIEVETIEGDILVKSAKYPQGRLISEGNKYSYPQDTITPIDRDAIIKSPPMQNFLNPNNWSSPYIPPRVADGILQQLGELRTALGLSPIQIASPSTPIPAGQSPGQTAFQPASPQQTGQLKTGTSYGDPHIITFDGFRYSFQTIGEFTLVKSKDGNFEVQVRQGAVPGRQLSLNTAVAMKVNNTRVAFYSKDFPDSDTTNPLRINGKPTVVQGGSLSLPGGGSISKDGESDYIVQWPTGEQLSVHKIEVSGFQFMNVTPAVPEQSGRFAGLLGNLNGNPEDDLQTRGGKVIPSKSTYGKISQALGNVLPTPIPLSQVENAFFEQLYKEFGDSWRISQADSLFDYGSGQSTQSFTNRSFPNSYMTLGSLLPAQIQQAETICRQAGVQENLLEGCIFDVGNTGEAGFAQAAVNVLKNRIIDEIRNQVPVPIPIP